MSLSQHASTLLWHRGYLGGCWGKPNIRQPLGLRYPRSRLLSSDIFRSKENHQKHRTFSERWSGAKSLVASIYLPGRRSRSPKNRPESPQNWARNLTPSQRGSPALSSPRAPPSPECPAQVGTPLTYHIPGGSLL